MHVRLQQLPSNDETPKDKVKIELSVIDTGKVSLCLHTKHVCSLTQWIGHKPELLEGIVNNLLESSLPETLQRINSSIHSPKKIPYRQARDWGLLSSAA